MSKQNLLLDTHIWIWLMLGEKLSIHTQKLLEDNAISGNICLSCISIWEISMLAAKNKIHLDRPIQEWVIDALTNPKIHLIPLTPDIAIESAYLPGDFHGDPADRIIVATARKDTLTLLTRDQKILDYSKNNYLKTIEA